MPSKLAVQMYTLRDHTRTAEDLDRALAKVAAIGYQAVQFSAIGCMSGAAPELSPQDARRMLDRHGLRCVATHRDWNDLLQRTDQEIAFHRTLGCDYAAIGSIPRPFHDKGPDGYREMIRAAAGFISKLKAAGIRWGYHNHSFEFARAERGGKRLFAVLIDESPPDFLFELDTYWAAHAGCSPAPLLIRLAGRIPVVHFKDMEVALGEGPVMAPIGEGNLDWDAIIAACEAGGTEWYCIEQDICRRDPFDCLESSLKFLSAKGL